MDFITQKQNFEAAAQRAKENINVIAKAYPNAFYTKQFDEFISESVNFYNAAILQVATDHPEIKNELTEQITIKPGIKLMDI